ncbi:MAG: hypothetical protein OEZ43_06985 [Gammaproteobacteria bacterium]|nr:hypothetical protein [Gammaproteobacteria bacterium]
MNRLHITTDQLRNMIGLLVRYEGVHCKVVEVVDEGPAIVLEDLEFHLSIQADQHGEAHRRVPQTYTIEVFSPDQLEFSMGFLNIEPVEQ